MQIGVDLASQPDKSVMAIAEAGHVFKINPMLKDFSTGTYAEAVAKLQHSYENLGPVLAVVGATFSGLVKQAVEKEVELIMKALLDK